MVSFSKLFNQGLRDAKCQEIFHPGCTCFQFRFGDTPTFLTTSMKFFLPIALIPLLTKGKNLNVWDTLMYYVESFMTAFFIAQSIPIAFCGTRAMCGRFNKYNFIVVPTMLSTWPVLFTTDRIARLFGISVFQVTLEIMIRSKTNLFSRAIYQSKLVKTILFMMCSTFILHAARKYSIKTVWIIRAIPKPKPDEYNKCAHGGPCTKFCLQELTKTFLIGIPTDLLKAFAESTSKGTSFINIFKKKLLNLDFPTTLFLSSYIGIYRFTSCLLSRNWEGDLTLKHSIAAFLGGASFYFLPRLTMLCYAAGICLEISWKLFKLQKFKNEHKFINIVKTIPFDRVCAILGTGYMVYFYIVRLHLLSPLGVEIVDALTANRAHYMKTNIFKYIDSLQK